MTKMIHLTRGFSAIVDDADHEWLSQFKWCYTSPRPGYGYAITTIRVGDRLQQIRMHRMIAEAPRDAQIDHHDGNGLNNVRMNLRKATRLQNGQNRKQSSRSRAPYKGITFYGGKWQVRVRANGQNVYVGGFDDPVDAARAYDAKALEICGAFARLNFPLEGNASAVMELNQAAFESPLLEDLVSVLTAARTLATQTGDHHLLGEIQRVVNRYNRTRNSPQTPGGTS